MDYSVRTYAYIGDAVYELFIREKTIELSENANKLHKITSSVVNAEFQAELTEFIEGFLTEEEKEILRRARNLSVTTARRTNQALHRMSTAFEAVVGYLHINNKERLEVLFKFIEEKVNNRLNQIYTNSESKDY